MWISEDNVQISQGLHYFARPPPRDVARTFIPPSLIQPSQIHASLQRTIDFRFEDFADLIVWLCYLLSLCLVWPGIGFPRPSGGDPKELRKCLAGAFPLFLVVTADVDASSGNNHLQILA